MTPSDSPVAGAPSHPAPRPSLKARAFDLSKDPALLRSYQLFQGELWFADGLPRQAWYWSANANLPGVAAKPVRSPVTASAWLSLPSKVRTALGNLGGFDADTLRPDDAGLRKVRAGYEKWPTGRYAIFQGGGTEPTNTCNLYVGEALFRDGVDLRRSDGKYYSANEIWKGIVPRLVRVGPDVMADGDIAAWGGHVEVVTAVDSATGHFCTVGGYRVNPPMGTPKCGDLYPTTHSLNAANLRFYRVQS